jgi:hypothetical protein
MLYLLPQGYTFAIRQKDADGSNDRLPIIVPGSPEILILPQRAVMSLSLILRPQNTSIATVDFCHDHVDDVRNAIAGLIWDPSVLGNVSAASSIDGKRLYYSGTATAIRVTAINDVCWLRGTV